MKKAIGVFAMIFIAWVHFSYGQVNPGSKKLMTKSDIDTRDYSNWAGVYRGYLPCADCPAVLTTLTIDKSCHYLLTTKYIGRQDSASIYAGSFSWNKKGNIIILDSASGRIQYQTSAHFLYQLDKNGRNFTGDVAGRFVLSRENEFLVGKNWKLIELNGKALPGDSSLSNEPLIIFSDDLRFHGNGGCNSISGAYQLTGGNHYSIAQVVSTKMFCPHMDIETEFLKVLQSASSFYANETILILNKGKTPRLAVFEAVKVK